MSLDRVIENLKNNSVLGIEKLNSINPNQLKSDIQHGLEVSEAKKKLQKTDLKTFEEKLRLLNQEFTSKRILQKDQEGLERVKEHIIDFFSNEELEIIPFLQIKHLMFDNYLAFPLRNAMNASRLFLGHFKPEYKTNGYVSETLDKIIRISTFKQIACNPRLRQDFPFENSVIESIKTLAPEIKQSIYVDKTFSNQIINRSYEKMDNSFIGDLVFISELFNRENLSEDENKRMGNFILNSNMDNFAKYLLSISSNFLPYMASSNKCQELIESPIKKSVSILKSRPLRGESILKDKILKGESANLSESDFLKNTGRFIQALSDPTRTISQWINKPTSQHNYQIQDIAISNINYHNLHNSFNRIKNLNEIAELKGDQSINEVLTLCKRLEDYTQVYKELLKLESDAGKYLQLEKIGIAPNLTQHLNGITNRQKFYHITKEIGQAFKQNQAPEMLKIIHTLEDSNNSILEPYKPHFTSIKYHFDEVGRMNAMKYYSKENEEELVKIINEKLISRIAAHNNQITTQASLGLPVGDTPENSLINSFSFTHQSKNARNEELDIGLPYYYLNEIIEQVAWNGIYHGGAEKIILVTDATDKQYNIVSINTGSPISEKALLARKSKEQYSQNNSGGGYFSLVLNCMMKDLNGSYQNLMNQEGKVAEALSFPFTKR